MRIKFLAALAVTVLFAACATAPVAPKTSLCQTAPQWYSNDAKGVPSAAIYVCFQNDNHLVYKARPLTADEIKAMMAPAPAPVSAPTPKAHVTKPKAKSSSLTTLGGTAK